MSMLKLGRGGKDKVDFLPGSVQILTLEVLQGGSADCLLLIFGLFFFFFFFSVPYMIL